MKDIDIRNRLKESLLKKYYLDNHSKVVEEMGIFEGVNRVDIAVVNGHLHGFEIKSESDNLLRLSQQINSYCKIFDYISVVASEKHVINIIDYVPSYCGIFKAINHKDKVKIISVRKPKINRSIESYALVQLLWKSELINILNELGIHKGLQSKPKEYLWNLLCKSLKKEEISNLVRKNLKVRQNWRVD